MVIVRASIESPEKAKIARHQLKICHEAGLRLALYGWLYFMDAPSPAAQAENWLLTGEGYPVEAVYVDCEDGTPYDAETTLAMIRQALYICDDARMQAGIYTRRGWWQDVVGDSDEFTSRALWDADFDGEPMLDGFEPYGGWQKRALKQYAADVPLGGVTVDLNVFISGK